MSAARDREHDAWIPWYVEDTPGWLELSLAARGAASEVARKMGQKRGGGALALPRGLSSLAVLIRVRWEDLEPALAELLERGRLTWDGAMLVDPEWEARQRSSSTTRMRKLRAKASPDDGVTERHMASHPVTNGHVRSPSRSGSGSDLPFGSGSTPQDGSPPAWWPEVLETIAANVGETLPPGEAWLRYDGHRAGKGIALSRKDALYWLTTVMVREVKAEREAAHHRAKRDAEHDAARARKRTDYTPTYVQPTPEESRRLAQQLAERLLGSRKVGT